MKLPEFFLLHILDSFLLKMFSKNHLILANKMWLPKSNFLVSLLQIPPSIPALHLPKNYSAFSFNQWCLFSRGLKYGVPFIIQLSAQIYFIWLHFLNPCSEFSFLENLQVKGLDKGPKLISLDNYFLELFLPLYFFEED